MIQNKILCSENLSQKRRIVLIKMFMSSFESFKDINILFKAILKFCATNQLFKDEEVGENAPPSVYCKIG